jgi:hypothetical protein
MVAGSLVTCKWDRVDALRPNAKTVTIVTKALVAGAHVNPAQVTTTTQDINTDNNFDTSTANVKVSETVTAMRGAVCRDAWLFNAPHASAAFLAHHHPTMSIGVTKHAEAPCTQLPPAGSLHHHQRLHQSAAKRLLFLPLF